MYERIESGAGTARNVFSTRRSACAECRVNPRIGAWSADKKAERRPASRTVGTYLIADRLLLR
jgi:hypothetical protein